MKKTNVQQKRLLKRASVILTAVLVLISMGTMVFADAAIFNPFATLAELTKKTEAEIKVLHETKALSVIAKEAGVLEAFKAKIFDAKKAIIDQRVKDGKMTQQDADKVLSTMKTRMDACDGTSTKLGRLGMGFGKGDGLGKGRGMGKGLGMGMGKGRGLGKGSCGTGL